MQLDLPGSVFFRVSDILSEITLIADTGGWAGGRRRVWVHGGHKGQMDNQVYVVGPVYSEYVSHGVSD